MALSSKTFKRSIKNIIDAAIYKESMAEAKRKNDPIFKKYLAAVEKAKKYRAQLKSRYSKTVRSKVMKKISR